MRQITLVLLLVCAAGSFAHSQTLILKADRMLDARSGHIVSPALELVLTPVNPRNEV